LHSSCTSRSPLARPQQQPPPPQETINKLLRCHALAHCWHRTAMMHPQHFSVAPAPPHLHGQCKCLLQVIINVSICHSSISGWCCFAGGSWGGASSCWLLINLHKVTQPTRAECSIQGSTMPAASWVVTCNQGGPLLVSTVHNLSAIPL
jgi:hypothetical protein